MSIFYNAVISIMLIFAPEQEKEKTMKRLFTTMTLVVTMMAFAQMANAQSQRMNDMLKFLEKHQPEYNALYAQGKYREAVEEVDALIQYFDTTTIYEVEPNIPKKAIEEQKGLFQYDKACIYALMGEKKQALATLEQCVNNGYKNYVNMLNDKDLECLHKDKKYKALLSIVEGRAPLNVLKKSAPYGKETKSESPFVYQPKESLNLRMVREYFQLDSIAGTGDEMSKIINLLHFAHDNIRHDGSNRAFAEMDAIDLYNYHKTTGKGVNCRQLAISLCEMYLSMGIPARYVTCMPADPFDMECHVINSVWSSQLGKWLYIDPTMDAWVMDEGGSMLSIAEVRERLIDGRPLVLCETANWNHESPQTKEYYLEQYMAKNLYYFVCKKISRFNPESIYRDNDPTQDVKLIPEGFDNDNYKCEYTTDPEYFWAKPE